MDKKTVDRAHVHYMCSVVKLVHVHLLFSKKKIKSHAIDEKDRPSCHQWRVKKTAAVTIRGCLWHRWIICDNREYSRGLYWNFGETYVTIKAMFLFSQEISGYFSRTKTSFCTTYNRMASYTECLSGLPAVQICFLLKKKHMVHYEEANQTTAAKDYLAADNE